MFQTLTHQGIAIECFVVNLTEPPQDLLPIIGDVPGTEPYAQALNEAIRLKIITEPGTYAINITDSGQSHNIFQVD